MRGEHLVRFNLHDFGGLVMDTTATVEEVGRWPVERQVEFAFRVWDQILDAGWNPTPSPELAEELQRRLAAHDADPEHVYTWDELLAHVRREP